MIDNLDEAVMVRARPFVLEALDAQPPAVRDHLETLLDSIGLGLGFVHRDGWLHLVFSIGGVTFCEVDARNVGLHQVDEHLVYLPDALLDGPSPDPAP